MPRVHAAQRVPSCATVGRLSLMAKSCRCYIIIISNGLCVPRISHLPAQVRFCMSIDQVRYAWLQTKHQEPDHRKK